MNSRVFVASSKDQIEIARAIRDGLRDYGSCEIWDEVTWAPSKSTLDNLLSFVDRYDFAVFVVTPDDLSNVEGKPSWKPRDNVVFEYGLFMGELGPERCFLVAPWGQKDFHLPTDLAGIVRPTYSSVECARGDRNLRSVVGGACGEIGGVIRRLGPQFGSTVFIVNKKSSHCIEILGSQSDLDDVPVQQHRILNRLHQMWGLRKMADGTFRITNMKSRKCLEAVAGEPLSRIRQTDETGSPNQRWRISDARQDGSFQIFSSAEVPLAVDSTTSATPIVLDPKARDDADSWFILFTRFELFEL